MYTSVLTWDEVVHAIWKIEGKEKAVLEGRDFTTFPNLIFIETDKKILFKSQDLIEKYNLKPQDSIHAATAVTNGIKDIISDDYDFDKVKELKRISLN